MSLPRRALRPALVAVALLAATAAAFFPVAGHGFLNYDDNVYVSHNPRVRDGLTPAGLRWALAALDAANWHPLTWVSHLLDVTLFGLRPAGHHAVNLLWHGANVLLLFLMLRSLTGALWASALGAALFALHPLQVESVAWVAERKNLLSTFFWLAGLGTYAHAVRRSGRPRLLPTAACAALALMAKPMPVTLPLTLMLLDRWPLARHRLPGFTWRRSLAEKAPLFGLAAAAGALTLLAQRAGGTIGSLADYPLSARLGTTLAGYVGYLGKAVWPSGLALPYPYRAPSTAEALAAGALLAGATWLAVALRRRQPHLLFGWSWFLLTLLPVIGLVQVGSQSMADRYFYVPAVGLFAALSQTAAALPWRGRWRAPAFAVSAAVLLLALGAAARRQTTHWRDSESLMRHALAVTDRNATAHNNLGVVLLQQGRPGEAIAHLRETLAINPRHGNARLNLGEALLQSGDASGAAREFTEGLRLQPGDAEAEYRLGVALLRLGRPEEAAAHLADSLRRRPAHAETRRALRTALTAHGGRPPAPSP